MTQPRVAPRRRADRFRRNPFVVIIAGFLVLLLGVDGLAQVATTAVDGRAWAELAVAVVVVPVALLVYRYFITDFLEGRAQAPEIAIDGRTPRYVWRGFLLAVFVMGVAYLLIAVIGGAQISTGQPWLTAIISSLALAAIAAVVEELFLRGVLFRVSEEYLGSWLALAVSAVFFGFLHLANPDASIWAGVAIALEAGVSLAAIYLLTRTLWVPIGVHLGWNFTESILGVPVSGNTPAGAVTTTFTGPAWLTGGAFGMEASVIVVLVWLAVAVAVLALAIRRGRLVAPRWRRTTA